MNYELNIKTGASTISGCRAVADFSNLQGLVFDDRFVMFSPKTAVNQSLVSFNGQTLSESAFSEVVLPFVTFKETSGEYYINSGASYKDARFSRDFSTAGFDGKNLIYDNRASGNFAIFSSSSTGAFNTGIESAIASQIPYKSGSLSDLDFYINGQKLYSGDSYTITGSNNRFNYTQGITGKLFAVEKNLYSRSLFGEVADFYGSGFIEGNCNYYWNGLEVSPDLWIETNTGVKTIVTGKVASLSFSSNEYEEFTL